MRRLLVVLAGGLGVGVVWRRLRRHKEGDAFEPDPAAELRAKLAETKASDDEPEVQEPTAGESARRPKAHDPAARRSAVHDRARAAIDELG